jgi:hypothetical protein
MTIVAITTKVVKKITFEKIIDTSIATKPVPGHMN